MSSPSSSAQEGLSQTTATSTIDLSSLSASLPSLDSTSSPGTDSGLAKPQGGIPSGIPLEVLERILRYTFLRRTLLTPSSDPFPLRGTTHLLLVSKAFRELCLPIFFEHLTIGRPSDYITFFDPKHGLFDVGEEGKKRWSYVHLLGIAYGVHPPPHFPDAHNPSWIVPLAAPLETRIPTVVIFDEELCTPPPIEAYLETVKNSVADVDQRTRGSSTLVAEYEQSPYFANGGRNYEEWVKATFDRDVEPEITVRIARMTINAIVNAQQQFYAKLLPTVLSYVLSDDPTQISHLLYLTKRIKNTSITHSRYFHVYQHPPTSSTPSTPASISSGFADLRRNVRFFYLRLVGYSKENRPFFLDQYDEEVLGPMGWKYILGGQEESALLFVPKFMYEGMLEYGAFRALPEAMELELRGKSTSAQAEASE